MRDKVELRRRVSEFSTNLCLMLNFPSIDISEEDVSFFSDYVTVLLQRKET